MSLEITENFDVSALQAAEAMWEKSDKFWHYGGCFFIVGCIVISSVALWDSLGYFWLIYLLGIFTWILLAKKITVSYYASIVRRGLSELEQLKKQ